MMEFGYRLEEFDDEIWISDSTAFLREKEEEGKAVVLLLTEDNKAADFSSFPFAVSPGEEAGDPFGGDEGALFDRDYLVKAYCRMKHIPLMLAQTDRILVRELTGDDAGAVHGIFEPEGAGKYLGQGMGEPAESLEMEGPVTGRELAEAVLTQYCKTAYDFSEGGIYAVEEKENKAFIGLVSLLDRGGPGTGEAGLWELGFALLPQYQGKGYGLEMCRVLLDCKGQLFDDGAVCLELEGFFPGPEANIFGGNRFMPGAPNGMLSYRYKNIFARVHKENAKARKLLAKLQFKQVMVKYT